MIKFTITKQSSKSRARLGILTTPHGEVETPTLVPVATQGTVKTLTSEETYQTGSQLLIANTFHLHLKPDEDIIKENGGLHDFMNWPHPLMTDSGGFQVFSLGFGRDHGVGKILKGKVDEQIHQGQQPKNITITNDGVTFKSPLDGAELYLDPATSIRIQQNLGADIIFAFDEATSPVADNTYTKASLERTHRWAKQSLDAKTSDQALFGIVQGGKFLDLRQASAHYTSALSFDGFGIGGEYGDDKRHMIDTLDAVNNILPHHKPRHLLGIGHLDDIAPIIQTGIDTFDCIAPTHYARHGTAFVSDSEHPVKSPAKSGTIPFKKLNLKNAEFLHDHQPLDPHLNSEPSQTYRRSYLAHLLRANEITALKILTYHNLTFFHHRITKLREQIKAGEL